MQEKYVEHFNEADNFTNKQELLASKMPNLFLKDANCNFIIKDSKVYYLINKNSLPDEIKKGLIGGNTTEYSKYTRLIDVYGVTDDLKVFYYNSEDGTLYGTLLESNVDISKIAASNLNKDTTIKNLITAELAKYGIVPSENGMSMYDVSVINDLKIDGNVTNEIESLNALSDLKNLKTLTLSNLELENLNGLEGCPNLKYLYFRNCKISNYSRLCDILKLQYLYLYFPSTMLENDANTQVTNLGNGLANASGLSKLQYLSISGSESFVVNGKDSKTIRGEGTSNLTNIIGLSYINNSIKNSILYLNLDNNSISSLENIEGYDSIVQLNINGNESLTSLNGLANTKNLSIISALYCGLTSLAGLTGSGLENIYIGNCSNLNSLNGLSVCTGLKTIDVNNSDITDITGIASMTTITKVNISSNINLANISTFATLTGLTYLNVLEDEAMIDSQVKSALADSGVAARCGNDFFYPGKYTKYFSAIDNWLDLSFTTIGEKLTSTSTDWINVKNRASITGLNLKGQDQLTDEDLQGTLSTLTGLTALWLEGTKINSLDFIGEGKVTGLLEISLINTSVTNLTKLNLLSNSGKGLCSLYISNSSTDFSTIQSILDSLYEKNAPKKTWSSNSWANGGLILKGNKDDFNFTNCTIVKRLKLGGNWDSYHSAGGCLDLSSCSSLKYISAGYVSINIGNNIKYIYIRVFRSINVSESFTGIEHLALNIDGYGYKSISNFFTNLKGTKTKIFLKELSIEQGSKDFDSSTSLACLEGVEMESLELNGYTLTNQRSSFYSINNLSYPTSLKTLKIQYDPNLHDISAISQMSGLKKLILSNCTGVDSTSSLSFANNSNLEYISLNNVSIGVISANNALSSVKYLRISDTNVQDVSFLSVMKNIETYLDEEGNLITFTLNLYNNKIRDLSPLLGLISYEDESDTTGSIHFTDLNLSNNNISANVTATNSNVDTLLKLHDAGLTTLNLSGNNFTKAQATRLVSAFGSGLTITYTDDE